MTARRDATPIWAWRTARWGCAAALLVIYPALFWLDEKTDLAFSPVLPGILVSVFLWIVLPPALAEWFRRMPGVDWRRAGQATGIALAVAVAWIFLWVSVWI